MYFGEECVLGFLWMDLAFVFWPDLVLKFISNIVHILVFGYHKTIMFKGLVKGQFSIINEKYFQITTE